MVRACTPHRVLYKRIIVRENIQLLHFSKVRDLLLLPYLATLGTLEALEISILYKPWKFLEIFLNFLWILEIFEKIRSSVHFSWFSSAHNYLRRS